VVFEGGSGLEGLELAELHHPDLVISDNRMPGMSGVDFLKTLRARPGFTHTPLILCSAAGEGSDAREAAKSPANAALISKPASLDTLRAAVAAGLNARPAETSEPLCPLLAARVPVYLAACETDLTLIERALAVNDFAPIKRIGHNMKGTAANYGFPQLTEIGGRLESAAIAGERAEVAAQLKNLAECLNAVRAERALPQQEAGTPQGYAGKDGAQ